MPPATTTTTGATPPPVDNQTDEWETVWASLMETRDWVAAHPENGDVLFEVFADDCPCLEEEFAFIDGLVELGLVSTQEPVELLDLTEVARPRDDRVILSIVMYRPPFSLVEKEGGAVYQSDLGDWTETLAVSLNNFDGRWLIQSLEVTDRVLGS